MKLFVSARKILNLSNSTSVNTLPPRRRRRHNWNANTRLNFLTLFEIQIRLWKCFNPWKNPRLCERTRGWVQTLSKDQLKLNMTYRMFSLSLPRAHYKHLPEEASTKKKENKLGKILNDLAAELIKHFWILIFTLFIHSFSPSFLPATPNSYTSDLASFHSLSSSLERRLTWQECLSYHICRHKAIRKNMPSTHSLPSLPRHKSICFSFTPTLKHTHTSSSFSSSEWSLLFLPKNNHFHSRILSPTHSGWMRGISQPPQHVSQT